MTEPEVGDLSKRILEALKTEEEKRHEELMSELQDIQSILRDLIEAVRNS